MSIFPMQFVCIGRTQIDQGNLHSRTILSRSRSLSSFAPFVLQEGEALAHRNSGIR